MDGVFGFGGSWQLQFVTVLFQQGDFYRKLPHTEARTAAPMAAVRVILVEGAPLSVTGLHLSVEQHSTVVW